MITEKITKDLLTGNPKFLQQCDEIYIATALISEYALDLTLRNIQKDTQVKILLGIHLPSTIKVLEKLLSLHNEKRLECRLYSKEFFHGKLYLFKINDSSFAYIGSGNFTKGGLFKNVELFHKSELLNEFDAYKSWFDNHYKDAKRISEKHLQILRPYLERQQQREIDDSQNIGVIADILEGNFNLDLIDFSNQFFKKEHHETFSPANRIKESDPEVSTLRNNTRKRLYELHDLLLPKINDIGWNLHPHYRFDDIVSKIEPSFHSNHEIGAMWVHYGRDKAEIKAYGENETPLFFSRLQVILHYNNIGIWLRFGKHDGSRQDREYFREKMKNVNYRLRCYNLITNLGNEYWINIGKERKDISSFNDENKFWEFTLMDDWRTDYFIIGMSLNLGVIRTSNENIVHTIIEEFRKLYPLYLHMKDKSFEKV
jgi:HKD family nuclease